MRVPRGSAASGSAVAPNVDDAALAGRDARGFEHVHHRHALGGGDGRRRPGRQRVRHAGVEARVVAGLALDGADRVPGAEPAPVRLGLAPPAGAARRRAGEQRVLLRVHAVLHERPGAAEDVQARPADADRGAGEQVRAHAVRVGEREEHVVHDVDLRVAAIELGVDVARRAEQQQRLIDEVDHEVEEQALAAGAGALDGPARFGRRPPALVARLEAVHRAERALPQQPLQRQDVGIPAPVLERDRQPPVPRGERGQVAGLVRADRERLVDHDVAAGGQRRRGQRRVRVVRRRDDDEVERRRHLEQLIGGRHDPRPRMTGRGRLDAAGIAGGDGGQLQAGGGADQRGVEGRAAEAVADESDAEGTGCGHGRPAYFNRRARRSSRRGRACRRWPRAARRAGACRRRRGS